MGAAPDVPPVRRALRLLRHVGAGHAVRNASRTAAELGINRTTLIRLLRTLEEEGYLERLPEGAGWRLGLGAFLAASAALASQDLVAIGQEECARLAAQTGLSAHLAVLDGREIVYLVRQTPKLALVSSVRVGSRLPAHATNMGRIMLAAEAEAAVRQRFAGAPLAPVTTQTPTSLAALLDQLRRDREAGLAWSDGFYEPGIASVAAAIRGRDGAARAAINLTGPQPVFAAQRAQLGEALAEAARRISIRLGHRGAEAPSDGAAEPGLAAPRNGRADAARPGRPASTGPRAR